jgi:hypothetical protein
MSVSRWTDFELALVVVLRARGFSYQTIVSKVETICPRFDRTTASLRGKISTCIGYNPQLVLDVRKNKWNYQLVLVWLQGLQLTPRLQEFCRRLLQTQVRFINRDNNQDII